MGQGRREGGRPGQWSSGRNSVSIFIEEKKVFPMDCNVCEARGIGHLESLCMRRMDSSERLNPQRKGIGDVSLLQCEWVEDRRWGTSESTSELVSWCRVPSLVQVRRKSQLLREMCRAQGYSVLGKPPPQPSPRLSTVTRGRVRLSCQQWWLGTRQRGWAGGRG